MHIMLLFENSVIIIFVAVASCMVGGVQLGVLFSIHAAA